MGYCRAGDILQDGTVIRDNHAVQKMAHQAPHREASDMELRVEAAQITADKRLMSRWMPSHQDLTRARDEGERLDIKMNDLAHRLAKKGTHLPVPPRKPQSIFVAGGEAPKPAKKWIHQLHQIERRTTTHWVSWLPLRGLRRRVWRPWLWGQMQWTGCEGRFKRGKRTQCTVCREHHGLTLPERLIECGWWKGSFWQVWDDAWDQERDKAVQWRRTATREELLDCAMLRIPATLVSSLGLKAYAMRKEIAHFQYVLYLGVTQLRSRLPMPEAEDYEGPRKAKPWSSKLRPRRVTPNPTVWRLHQQVRLPSRMPSEGRRATGRPQLTMDRCTPLTDAWCKCLLPERGELEGRDDARILVSHPWGLRFMGGAIVQDGASLEASRETQGWLEQHKALQDNLWTEYMKSLRVIRRGYLTVRSLTGLVHNGCTRMEQAWREASLWAVAWKHSWTHNARKMVGWGEEVGKRLGAQKEQLWCDAQKAMKGKRQKRLCQ